MLSCDIGIKLDLSKEVYTGAYNQVTNMFGPIYYDVLRGDVNMQVRRSWSVTINQWREKSTFFSNYDYFRSLFLGFNGCEFPQEEEKSNVQEDLFYSNNEGILDRCRIPLLKPYELIKVSVSEWAMDLQTPALALAVHNIKGVNVNRDKILLHSQGGTDLRIGQDIGHYNEAWVIVDVTKKEEKAFVVYEKYKDTLAAMGLNDTVLVSPEKVYETFKKTGQLKWH